MSLCWASCLYCRASQHFMVYVSAGRPALQWAVSPACQYTEGVEVELSAGVRDF